MNSDGIYSPEIERWLTDGIKGVEAVEEVARMTEEEEEVEEDAEVEDKDKDKVELGVVGVEEEEMEEEEEVAGVSVVLEVVATAVSDVRGSVVLAAKEAAQT